MAEATSRVQLPLYTSNIKIWKNNRRRYGKRKENLERAYLCIEACESGLTFEHVRALLPPGRGHVIILSCQQPTINQNAAVHMPLTHGRGFAGSVKPVMKIHLN